MPREASSENQTIVAPWNISALKAYLEAQIVNLGRETDLKFEGRDKALHLQATINEDHFKALNNEAARLLKNVEITVSRDMWDAYIHTDREWKNRTELLLSTMMPKAEFHAYKESTERALNLGTGKTSGILQLFTTGASIAAIVGVAVVLLK